MGSSIGVPSTTGYVASETGPPLKDSRKELTRCLGALVTGDAMWHYRKHVHPTLRLREWKPEDVFAVLQNHCFPWDHKIRSYERLKSAKQGNRKVVVFAEEVEFLARHLPSVSNECLALVFYSGLNRRIRSMLISDDIDLWSVDLETLIQRASRHW